MSQTDGCSPLEQQTTSNGSQIPEVIETSQPRVICDRPEALHSALGSMTGIVMKTIHKGLRSFYLYDIVDANLLKLDALKKYEVPTAGLPMLFSEFSASTGTVLQLQLLFVRRRLTTILAAEIDELREVELLENKPADTSIYYKHCNRVG